MFYTFNDDGNDKAADAMGSQGTASRSSTTSPTGEASRSTGTGSTAGMQGDMTATVRGELEGNRIKVDSIQIQ
jgi:hypothetical protein